MRTNQESPGNHIEDIQKKARAFTELVAYIESGVEEGTFCFKFADLRHLFEKRLKEFGIDTEVNNVRFKEKIEAQAQSDGKNNTPYFSARNAANSEICSKHEVMQ
jgi:hypothetical protein